MKDRHLKIYEASGSKRNVPKLQLQGDWLSSLGYHVGDRVKVSLQEDRIVIEKESSDPSANSLAN